MNLIADEKILFESPDPGSIYCYTPAIVEGESGRLIAAFDLGGPGTEQLKGPRSDFGDWPTGNQIRILLSDDDGASWREAQNRVPMMHEILFKSGNALYLLGHSGRLVISRSNDNGESWSEPVTLEADHLWHQSAGRVAIPIRSWTRHAPPAFRGAIRRPGFWRPVSDAFTIPGIPSTIRRIGVCCF